MCSSSASSLQWNLTVRFPFLLLLLVSLAAGASSGEKPHLRSRHWEGRGPATQRLTREPVQGDWIAGADILAAGRPSSVIFTFADSPGGTAHLELRITPQNTALLRHDQKGDSHLAAFRGAGSLPWKVKIRRRGAYYFFEINGHYLGFTFHPSGDLDGSSVLPSSVEPSSTYLSIQFPAAEQYDLQNCRVMPVTFGQRMSSPLISPGPAGSWNQAEVFPGAVIEDSGTYFMYLNGTDWTSKSLEGGGHTRAGLASSKDLIHWNVDPRGPILNLGPQGSWDSSLVMVNGATRTADGKFAVTYMGFDGKTWAGIGLATADRPEGPYIKWPGNPVLKADPKSWDTVIHEHALYRDGDRYVLFYTGFDGKKGDRGGLAYSKDLIHWTKDLSNPVFNGEGPDRWDSMHLRPRSLFRHGQYFYLFFEGAGTRPKFSAKEDGVQVKNELVFDSVGLARSRDLHHWESFPWNPAIAQTGEKSFDALWTGWPHAVLRPEGVFVFYAASDAWGFARKQGRVYTGLMRFTYRELEQWGNSLDQSAPRR